MTVANVLTSSRILLIIGDLKAFVLGTVIDIRSTIPGHHLLGELFLLQIQLLVMIMTLASKSLTFQTVTINMAIVIVQKFQLIGTSKDKELLTKLVVIGNKSRTGMIENQAGPKMEFISTMLTKPVRNS